MDIRQLVRVTGARHGLDPDLFEAQIRQESGFNPNARSGSGAMGLGQLMPGTAAELGVKNPWDPAANLDGAARYMKQQLQAFGGDYDLALAAYNAGPGAVQKAGNRIPGYRETQDYVRRIRSNAAQLKTQGGASIPSSPPAANGIRPLGVADPVSPPVTAANGIRPLSPGGQTRMAAADPVDVAMSGLDAAAKAAQAPRFGTEKLAQTFAALAAAAGAGNLAPALKSLIGSSTPSATPVLTDLVDASFGFAPKPATPAAPVAPVAPVAPAAPAAPSGFGATDVGDSQSLGSGSGSRMVGAPSSAPGGRRVPLRTFASMLQRLGFTVRENALLGTPVGRHSQGSLHYDNDAVDLTVQRGSRLLAGKPDSAWPQVTQEWGERLQRLFPQKQILHRGNDPRGHSEHIHLGMRGLKDGVELTPEAEQLFASMAQ